MMGTRDTSRGASTAEKQPAAGGTAQEQLDQRTDHAQGRNERAAHEEEPGEKFQELDEAAKEAPTPIDIKTYSHIYTQSQGPHEQLVQVDRLDEPSQEPDHQKQHKQEPGPQAATDAQSLIGNEAHDDDTALGTTHTHKHTLTPAPKPTQIINLSPTQHPRERFFSFFIFASDFGISTGLINQNYWENSKWYYVNVERGNAADKLNGRNFNVSFTNNPNFPIEVLVFFILF